MVGSIRAFEYTSDSTLKYAVRLDENYEEADFAFAPISSGPSGPVARGRILKASSKTPIRMRYVCASRVDADNVTITRRFWIGSATAPVFTGAQATLTRDGVTWNVTCKRGEQATFIPATDTGQIDGDVDDNFAA